MIAAIVILFILGYIYSVIKQCFTDCSLYDNVDTDK